MNDDDRVHPLPPSSVGNRINQIAFARESPCQALNNEISFLFIKDVNYSRVPEISKWPAVEGKNNLNYWN